MPSIASTSYWTLNSGGNLSKEGCTRIVGGLWGHSSAQLLPSAIHTVLLLETIIGISKYTRIS